MRKITEANRRPKNYEREFREQIADIWIEAFQSKKFAKKIDEFCQNLEFTKFKDFNGNGEDIVTILNDDDEMWDVAVNYWIDELFAEWEKSADPKNEDPWLDKENTTVFDFMPHIIEIEKL